MRLTTALLLLALPAFLAPAPFANAQETPPPPTPPAQPAPEAKPRIYDESADARAQIDAALARAAKENRRVLVQWGANWCGWCIRLHELFRGDAGIRRTLLYEYDLVYVDIGQWDKHMDIAESYGADLKSHGVPFLTILAPDGTVLANQETGSLEAPEGSTPAHDPGKVKSFLDTHKAAPLDARTVLDDALAKARDEGKSVFLHFGAPWCGWCHRLEAFIAREDIRAILDPALVDAKIDIDRMTGGQELLDKLGGAGQGIPWFVFLNAAGDRIATSADSGENIGYPGDAPSAEAFSDMLAKLPARIDRDQLRAIRRELVDSMKPKPRE